MDSEGEAILVVGNEAITYLVWKDDDAKKPVRDKLIAAIKCHIEKFKTVPTECLVSQVEFDALAPHETIPLHVAPRNFVPRHQFYVGRLPDVRESDAGRELPGVPEGVSDQDSE